MITKPYRPLLKWIEEFYPSLPSWVIPTEDVTENTIYTPKIYLEALILQESNGDPNAYRYEPRLDDASYGLMQVLKKTAENVTNTIIQEPRVLFRPLFNISIGMSVIFDIIGSANHQKIPLTVPLILARYNGGPSNNPDKDGKLRNQRYVDNVLVKCKIIARDYEKS